MQFQGTVDELLAQFWEDTRLRVDAATPLVGPASPDDREFRHRLAVALGLGYGERPGTVITKGGTRMTARTTPSAGALYPVEVLVSVPEPGAPAYRTYHYDVAGRCLRPLSTVATSALRGALGAAAAPGADRYRAVLTVLARPWLSMTKYGMRGYLYTSLDVAHVATNLALAARAVGLHPMVHLRIPHRVLSDQLGLTDLCREPQVMISLGGGPSGEPVADGPAGDQAWRRVAAQAAVPAWHAGGEMPLEPPSIEERANWELLRHVSPYHTTVPVPPSVGETISISPPASGPRGSVVELPGGDGAREFAATALRRSSAKGFRAEPITLESLGRLVAGLRRPLPMDCADQPFLPVGVRLLARRVTGAASGAYDYHPDTHTLSRVGPAAPDGLPGIDDGEVVAACMGQELVRPAALLVVLHIPLHTLLCHGPGGLIETHFHAAHVAQRLCLGAVAAGIGITCIGGFDDRWCARLAGLGPDDDVIYVLAAGVPDATGVKRDRSAVAYDHGQPGSSRPRSWPAGGDGRAA